ncbi:MAG TPA: tyrosine recombinase XerC [Clostridiales bacterium]|nr:tyrosine recombinase XerC [Clostridiales bacterium]
MSDRYEGAPEVLRRFLAHMETIRGKSRRSAQEYFLDLRIFLRFLKKHRGLVPSNTEFDEISIEDVTLDLLKTVTTGDIYEYMFFLGSERTVHPNSRNATVGLGAAARARKVSSLRAFFKYLTVKTQQLSVNPMAEMDSPAQKKSLPKYLTEEESRALLESVSGENAERDFCILTFFLNCGLRVSELVQIDVTDIKGDLLQVTGKGNKERTIYLNEACLAALSAWLPVRQTMAAPGERALFVTRRRHRISAATVKWLVKKHIGEAGLDTSKYSAHKLRHTAATLMHQHGVDMLELQKILGHEQLTTTEIYTHLDDASLRRAVKANPLSSIKPPRRSFGKTTTKEIKHEEEV